MTSPRHWLPILAGAAALIAGTVSPGAAQNSLQIPLQFDFVNPGAKSLALAGAFTGVADDATAAFANPAGLTLLGGPEASAEVRGFRIETPYLAGGRLSGTVSNIGIDTIQGPSFGESVGSHVGLGFLSGVYMSRSRRWVIAGYRREVAHVDQSYSSSGVFQQDPAEATARHDFSQDLQREISINAWGGSGAFKLTQAVSIGAGIAIYDFDIDTASERFLSQGFFGPRISETAATLSTQVGDDVAVAPIVGVTFDRGPVRIGAVYRQGPTFRYDNFGDGVQDLNLRFRVPHTLAVGVSRRTSTGLLISGEIAYINYSRLEDDFVTSQARGRAADFQVHDGTELHGSIQYPWRRQSGPPIRLRAGAWYDPDHSVKFEPVTVSTTPLDRTVDELMTTALGKGQWAVHGTGGVGLTLNNRLEVNAGFDGSSRGFTASGSMILHLGKGMGP